MRILFFGDIVGRPGREAIKKHLPKLKNRLSVDFVITNAENLAHGKGVTYKTIEEMNGAGIDFFTSGNHIFENKQSFEILKDEKNQLIRPANMPKGIDGRGYKIIQLGGKKILIINLIGRVFMHFNYNCPFKEADSILKKEKDNFDISIVDFHAEATSEKVALGRYLDGRIGAFLGTHTHIQTSDEKISNKNTAYITDVGMVGPQNSILGADPEPILKRYLSQIPSRFEVADDKNIILNAVLVELGGKNSAKKIKRISKIVKI